MDIEGRVGSFVHDDPGRAVVLRTVRGRNLHIQRNADRVFPAASLMKVPLAVAALDHLDAALIVKRSELGRTAYPSLLEVFGQDHEFTLAELCGLMLATSDNPIADYLLDRVGRDAVTATAVRTGAHHTYMRVGFTDDELGPAARESTTTARDVSCILQYVATEARLRPLVRALRNSMRNFRLPLRLPDELPVAHKTGSLNGLAHDAGILFGRDNDLIAVFLTDNQRDTAAAGLHIGDCVADVWQLLGESV